MSAADDWRVRLLPDLCIAILRRPSFEVHVDLRMCIEVGMRWHSRTNPEAPACVDMTYPDGSGWCLMRSKHCGHMALEGRQGLELEDGTDVFALGHQIVGAWREARRTRR